MARLDLTDEEASLLKEVLAEYVSDLRLEVGGTDSMDFREALKEKERILGGLIERLGPARN